LSTVEPKGPHSPLPLHIEKMAWVVIGRLIFSGILQPPDLDDPAQIASLRFAITEVGWVLEDLCK
jgi:hypothetical protein